MGLAEKYRPKRLDEIVGQKHRLRSGVIMIESLKNLVRRLKENEKMKVNLLFTGTAGTGKTTAAICIAKELFGKGWRSRFLELNASDERGIDTVRDKIKSFARAVGRRIIFLDEADALTPDAQHALRAIMENYQHTIFILSCNYPHKIIDPIKSRCAIYPFRKIPPDDIIKRLVYIIQSEGYEIKDENATIQALMAIAEESDGDMRKAINLLEQILESNRELTREAVIMHLQTDFVAQAMEYALNGDIESAVKSMEEAYIMYDYDTTTIIRKIYKYLNKIQDKSLKTKLLLKWGELDYRCTVGSDPLVQLIWFVSNVWVLKQLPDSCPAIQKMVVTQ